MFTSVKWSLCSPASSEGLTGVNKALTGATGDDGQSCQPQMPWGEAGREGGSRKSWQVTQLDQSIR